MTPHTSIHTYNMCIHTPHIYTYRHAYTCVYIIYIYTYIHINTCIFGTLLAPTKFLVLRIKALYS